jgi:signal transduction histidine kinase
VLTKSRTIKKKDIFEDGTERTYLSNVVPLKNELGRIIGKAAITLDVSSSEPAKESKLRDLEEKANLCKVYAAGIAHELRTPLATIQTLAATLDQILPVLLEAYNAAEKKDLLGDNFLNSAQKLAALDIAGMLLNAANSASSYIDIAMVQLGGKEVDPTQFQRLSIADCLFVIKDSYSFIGNEEELVHFDEARDFEFQGDVNLLKHVINNLLKNALYYLRAFNKKDPKIDIWFEQGNKFNILHFRDNGAGIPREVLPHIFEPFYSKRPGGSGIGLSLSKALVDKMGGNITCDSVEGEYTHFKIYLPRLEKA